MIGWSGTHDIPSNLFPTCSKNDTLTKLSILNHTRTCKYNPIRLVIKVYLEALYGINGIEENICTEQESVNIQY